MSDSDLNNSLGMLEIEQTNLENIKKLYYISAYFKENTTYLYETYNFIYLVNSTYYLKMQPLLLQYIFQYKYPNKVEKFEDLLIYK